MEILSYKIVKDGNVNNTVLQSLCLLYPGKVKIVTQVLAAGQSILQKDIHDPNFAHHCTVGQPHEIAWISTFNAAIHLSLLSFMRVIINHFYAFFLITHQEREYDVTCGVYLSVWCNVSWTNDYWSVGMLGIVDSAPSDVNLQC